MFLITFFKENLFRGPFKMGPWAHAPFALSEISPWHYYIQSLGCSVSGGETIFSLLPVLSTDDMCPWLVMSRRPSKDGRFT